MSKEDIIRSCLIDLGFGEVEASLYVALLRLGEATISECVKLSGVGRTAAYAAMKRLVDAGLVGYMPGKPNRYRALPPRAALTELLNKRLRDLEQERVTLSSIVESVVSMAEKMVTSPPEELTNETKILVLKGLRTMVSVMSELEKRARDTVRILADMPPPTIEGVELIEDAVADAVEKGQLLYRPRIIMDSELLEFPYIIQLMRGIWGVGDMRCMPDVPIEMVIYDDFAALLTLVENLENPVMLLVQNKQLIAVLIAAFESLWEKATPVEKEVLCEE